MCSYQNPLFLKLILSQEDIATILRTLNENLWDNSGTPPPLPESKDTNSNYSDALSTSQHSAGKFVKVQQQSSILMWHFQVNFFGRITYC